MTWGIGEVDDIPLSPNGGTDPNPVPWWDLPTPNGPPKTQNMPGACWQDAVAKTGERFWIPVMCNGAIPYPPGTIFPNGVPWQEWFAE